MSAISLIMHWARFLNQKLVHIDIGAEPNRASTRYCISVPGPPWEQAIA